MKYIVTVYAIAWAIVLLSRVVYVFMPERGKVKDLRMLAGLIAMPGYYVWRLIADDCSPFLTRAIVLIFCPLVLLIVVVVNSWPATK